MIIKKISIKNFRGIKELNNFEFNNYNVLVGKNDSEKSIILYALKSFFDGKIDQKDIYKGNEGNNVEIEVSFQINKEINQLMLDSDGYLTIKKVFNNECKLTDTQYKSFDYIDTKVNDLWNRDDKYLEDIIKSQGVNVTGRKTSEKISQIMDLQKVPKGNIYHSYGELDKHLKKYYEVELPEYNFFQSEENIDPNATDFQSKFKNLAKTYFSSQKDELEKFRLGVEKQYKEEFDQILEYMSKNVPEVKAILPKIDTDWLKSINKFDLLLNTSIDQFDIPISHKGTGFRRMLMVAYFEYIANKNQIENSLFAIEEPEIYLHPSAQETLLESLLEISTNSQVFITTHSPIFAGADNIESIVLVTKDTRGISRYNRKNDTKDIIDELGIKANYNLLKNAEIIIFVEGPSDIVFLTCYAREVLSRDLLKDNVVCTIGGGDNLSNFVDLDLFHRLKPDNIYAVMVDGDKNNPKIESKCLSDGALFFRLPKREIENYCHPETITKIYNMNPPCRSFSCDEDVETEIKKIHSRGSIKDKKNIKIFESMSRDQWVEMDNDNKVHDFLVEVLRRIGK